jgi:two-component system cell cycle sensor histidine kinase/response regulator CckA
MRDQDKTRQQLIGELAELRQRTAELEASEARRKRAEEALRETEKRLRSIIEQSNDSIVLTNEQGAIIEWNCGAEQIFGLKRDEVLGRFICDVQFQVVPEERRTSAVCKRLEANVLESLRTGRAPWLGRLLEEEIQRPGGERRIIQTSVFPIETHRGFMLGGISRDITEREQIEESLQEEKETFFSILQKAPYGVLLIDQDERSLYINPEFTKITGHTLDEIPTVGDWFERAFPDPAYREEVIERWKSDTVQRISRVFSVVCGGDEVKEVEFRPTLLDSGRAVLVLSDVTERKQAETERERLMAQVEERARQVQQIVDTVPEGMLLLNANRQAVLANPVGEKDLVTLARAKVGDTLTHLGDRPLDELLTSPPKGLWHEVATDGRNFQVLARSIEAGAAPSGWLLVIRDVTQQREVERRIHQQERLAAVGQLAAGIAHDFNNIMATIVLYAQTTAWMEGLPNTARERMETINQQAKHASNLIQQILDFSRRAVLERRPLDLAPLLKEHVKLLERTLLENIEIELDYEPGEHAAPLIVNADPARMQQMVTNLALNARDAMPEGGILRIGLERIAVKPGESPLLPEMEPGEWVQMTVSDTGTGISSDVLPHIFEPFFTTKERGRGSGLGLAQVYGIVAQHEGRIDVETQVGKGTTITVYLPLRPSEPSTAVSLRELPVTSMGRGETVLVVEDDTNVRKALVDSLEMLNYRALQAVNGQEALTTLEELGDEIGLVLSDVVMPRMGGVALFHALRERGLGVPVVLLTGHPLEKEMEDLRLQGLADWLPKPPGLERLAEVVARALGTN